METNTENIHEELEHFNWGAACFGPIWGIGCKCFRVWIINIIALIIISGIAGLGVKLLLDRFLSDYTLYTRFANLIIPIFIFITVFIYSGKNGNKLVWENDTQADLDDFIQKQRTWGIIAAIFMFIAAIGIVVNIHTISSILRSNKSTNPYNKNISQNGCRIMSDIIPDAILKVKNNEHWINAIAEEIDKEKDISYCFGNEYTGKLDVSIGDVGLAMPEMAEFAVVKGKSCSIKDANCYIYATATKKGTACRFYFDDDGNVIPSESTVSFIEKTD